MNSLKIEDINVKSNSLISEINVSISFQGRTYTVLFHLPNIQNQENIKQLKEEIIKGKQNIFNQVFEASKKVDAAKGDLFFIEGNELIQRNNQGHEKKYSLKNLDPQEIENLAKKHLSSNKKEALRSQLIDALREKKFSVAKELIQKGAPLEMSHKDTYSLIAEMTLESFDNKAIESLKSLGLDFNHTYENQPTLLEKAILNESLSSVFRLIYAGAKFQQTPAINALIRKAVLEENHPLLEMFYRLKADFNLPYDSISHLEAPLLRNNSSMALKLKSYGAVFKPTDKILNSIKELIEKKDIEGLKNIKALGFNFTTLLDKKHTAAEIALTAFHGDTSQIEFIFEHQKNKEEAMRHALMFFIETENLPALACFPVDYTKPWPSGISPIDYALGLKKNSIAIFLSLQKEKTAESLSKFPKSAIFEKALELAIVNNNPAVLFNLAKIGFDFNQKIGKEKLSPLEVALQQKNFSLAKKLLDLGATVHQTEVINQAIFQSFSDVNIAHIKFFFHEMKINSKASFASIKDRILFVLDEVLDSGFKKDDVELFEMLEIWGFKFNSILSKGHKIPIITVALAHQSLALIKSFKEGGQDELLGKNILYQKYLAHVYGLEGTGKALSAEGTQCAFELSGIFAPNYPVLMLAKSISFFLKEQKNAPFARELTLIKAALLEAGKAERSSQEAVKKILAKEPYVISSGFYSHQVTYTLFDGKLMIGNRGDRADHRSAGIDIYELPNDKVTPALIEFLEKRHSVRAFEKGFDSFKLKFLHHIHQKDQKVGNCTWASSKSALLSLAFCLTKESTDEKKLKEAFKIYKNFTAYERMRALYAYNPSEEDGLWKGLSQKFPKKFARFADSIGIKVPELLKTQASTFAVFCKQLETFKQLGLFSKEAMYRDF